ncbi:hypothetical protein BOO71_0003481 [Deinococcus marmoris]|uniref:Uncharacterized protein n=1 Tax=Deinococcus marmoris TaxID=249408 RepID=A0A1U7P243_9DEIO|nr:hypothetical protein BOO71_0003481 [Deinococcus marmoris]
MGKGSLFAPQALAGGFIGIDDGIGLNMTPLLDLPEPDFRAEVRSRLETANPSASRGTLSQYATTLWRVAQGIQVDDQVLSPTGTPGQVRLGRVTGEYHYVPGEPLPHRRSVT